MGVTTYDDLVRSFVEKNGRLPQQADWPILVDEWIRFGEIGCTFAAKMVRSREEAKWESVMLEGLRPEVFEALERELDAAFERRAEAISFVLAGIVSPDQIVDFIVRLCGSPRWFCELIEPGADGFSSTFANCAVCRGNYDDHVHNCPDINVGLRYVLPNEQIVWALGVSPLAQGPATRVISGAPFTTLFLRSSPAPDSDQPGRTVHLCHMRNERLQLSPEGDTLAKWDKMMDTSSKLRAQKLRETRHCSGKAKVTFTVPALYRPFLPLESPPSIEVELAEESKEAK